MLTHSVTPEIMLLSRYEVCRIITSRALQLNDGAAPLVPLEYEGEDSVRVATREVMARAIDAMIVRGGVRYPLSECSLPRDVHVLMDVMHHTNESSKVYCCR